MWAGQKNDTPFSDEAVLQEHIVVGITLVNAVNFLEECMSWFVLNALDLVGKSHLCIGLLDCCDHAVIALTTCLAVASHSLIPQPFWLSSAIFTGWLS